MDELEVKNFYKNNKSYCAMPFKEIYADNAGRYKLCCHAKPMKELDKYRTKNTPPFKYFLSNEMEEVRNKMLSGEKIDACKVCYRLEENGESYRTAKYRKKYGVDLEPVGIGLKLRIHGSYCNLGCYMCHPYNSSTRRKEITNVFGKNSSWNQWEKYQSLNYTQWNEIVDDILDNIDKVAYMNITGGEPLQLPGHWKLLDMIPDEYAKNIELSYDTNLTELSFKKWSIFDYVKKFKKIFLGVSCDHYGDKLSWIRYPIDVKKFEENLVKAKSLVKQINCTVSLLNIFDLDDIGKYYNDKFDLKVTFHNIVRGPEFLSIRNLTQAHKDLVIEKYKNIEAYSYIEDEITKKPTHNYTKLKIYCDKLSEHRKLYWRELWNEFGN